MKIKIALLTLSTGCISAGGGDGKRGDYESWESEIEESFDQEDATEEEDDSPSDLTGALYLTPDEAPPGSVFITSIRSDYALDWGSIINVEAYGDIEICKTQALYDQLLLTVSIDRDVPESRVDFVIEYSDGDIDFIEDGLSIDYEADLGSAEVGLNDCD